MAAVVADAEVAVGLVPLGDAAAPAPAALLLELSSQQQRGKNAVVCYAVHATESRLALVDARPTAPEPRLLKALVCPPDLQLRPEDLFAAVGDERRGSVLVALAARSNGCQTEETCLVEFTPDDADTVAATDHFGIGFRRVRALPPGVWRFAERSRRLFGVSRDGAHWKADFSAVLLAELGESENKLELLPRKLLADTRQTAAAVRLEQVTAGGGEKSMLRFVKGIFSQQTATATTTAPPKRWIARALAPPFFLSINWVASATPLREPCGVCRADESSGIAAMHILEGAADDTLREVTAVGWKLFLCEECSGPTLTNVPARLLVTGRRFFCAIGSSNGDSSSSSSSSSSTRLWVLRRAPPHSVELHLSVPGGTPLQMDASTGVLWLLTSRAEGGVQVPELTRIPLMEQQQPHDPHAQSSVSCHAVSAAAVDAAAFPPAAAAACADARLARLSPYGPAERSTANSTAVLMLQTQAGLWDEARALLHDSRLLPVVANLLGGSAEQLQKAADGLIVESSATGLTFLEAFSTALWTEVIMSTARFFSVSLVGRAIGLVGTEDASITRKAVRQQLAAARGCSHTAGTIFLEMQRLCLGYSAEGLEIAAFLCSRLWGAELSPLSGLRADGPQKLRATLIDAGPRPLMVRLNNSDDSMVLSVAAPLADLPAVVAASADLALSRLRAKLASAADLRQQPQAICDLLLADDEEEEIIFPLTLARLVADADTPTVGAAASQLLVPLISITRKAQYLLEDAPAAVPAWKLIRTALHRLAAPPASGANGGGSTLLSPAVLEKAAALAVATFRSRRGSLENAVALLAAGLTPSLPVWAAAAGDLGDFLTALPRPRLRGAPPGGPPQNGTAADVRVRLLWSQTHDLAGTALSLSALVEWLVAQQQGTLRRVEVSGRAAAAPVDLRLGGGSGGSGPEGCRAGALAIEKLVPLGNTFQRLAGRLHATERYVAEVALYNNARWIKFERWKLQYSSRMDSPVGQEHLRPQLLCQLLPFAALFEGESVAAALSSDQRLDYQPWLEDVAGAAGPPGAFALALAIAGRDDPAKVYGLLESASGDVCLLAELRERWTAPESSFMDLAAKELQQAPSSPRVTLLMARLLTSRELSPATLETALVAALSGDSLSLVADLLLRTEWRDAGRLAEALTTRLAEQVWSLDEWEAAARRLKVSRPDLLEATLESLGRLSIQSRTAGTRQIAAYQLYLRATLRVLEDPARTALHCVVNAAVAHSHLAREGGHTQCFRLLVPQVHPGVEAEGSSLELLQMKRQCLRSALSVMEQADLPAVLVPARHFDLPLVALKSGLSPVLTVEELRAESKVAALQIEMLQAYAPAMWPGVAGNIAGGNAELCLSMIAQQGHFQRAFAQCALLGVAPAAVASAALLRVISPPEESRVRNKRPLHEGGGASASPPNKTARLSSGRAYGLPRANEGRDEWQQVALWKSFCTAVEAAAREMAADTAAEFLLAVWREIFEWMSSQSPGTDLPPFVMHWMVTNKVHERAAPLAFGELLLRYRRAQGAAAAFCAYLRHLVSSAQSLRGVSLGLLLSLDDWLLSEGRAFQVARPLLVSLLERSC